MATATRKTNVVAESLALLTSRFQKTIPPWVTWPVIASLVPSYGQQRGGDTIEIPGFNLGEITSCTFGDVVAAIVSVADDRVIVTTPAHPGVGVVDVRIDGANGSATLEDAFVYDGARIGDGWTIGDGTCIDPVTVPTPGLVTPSTGSAGDTLVVSGAGFSFGVTSVLVDGISATILDVDDDSDLRIVAPAHANGTVDITVRGPAGARSLVGGFTYA